MDTRAAAHLWDDIASSLEYPCAGGADKARRAAQGLEGRPGADALVVSLRGLGDYLDNAGVGEAEEHYTILFDLKPVCSLYVGWHIFQDTYARGALLAGLAQELTDAGVPHGHDLPDFLPSLLRLLGRMEEPGDRAVLAHGIVLRGLEIVEEKLNSVAAPWARVLCALRAFLEADAPRGTFEIPVLQKPEREAAAW